MKKLIVILIAAMLSTSAAYATTKCERTPSGGFCCWNVEEDGPWRPIACG